MQNILRDHTPSSLVAAIEENTYSLFPLIKKWPRVTAYDGPEVKWALTDIPFPMFNSIMRARLTPEGAGDTIQSVIAQAKDRSVPLLWMTGPATQPADLGARLIKYGFVRAGRDSGMAADLRDINQADPTPAGLTVQLVEGEGTLKQWCQVLGTGFSMPDFVVDAYYDFLSCLGLDAMSLYLGWMDGQTVAISQLLFGAGVAGIYSVATIPGARRQGIGTAMTLAPMLEARERGYEIAVLNASEMGEGVYRSLGFKTYCQIVNYIWSPKQK